ncbi:MAG: fimbrillin family protein [Alistipes sp.]|nr:fimbrillin family protein [Alistipes sp.]
MKKIIFALLAVAAMVGCAKEEVIELNREQIGFGEVFVDNATRADYSSGKPVEAFKVYGTITALENTAQIFNGANVTRGSKADGEAWGCDNVQYWMPNAVYNFAAIVDGEAVATTALPVTINHTVADGANNKDLLYATATVETDETAAPDNVNGNGVVAFNFSHLLSKLQFNIVNATNQTYQVTEIRVTGVAKEGVYTVNGGTWAQSGVTTTELTFGTATVAGGDTEPASETRQILPLPVAQTLNVTITYDVMSGDDVVGTLTKEGTITQTFAKNTVYAVTATLTGSAIDFSLGTVGGWGAENGEITVQ